MKKLILSIILALALFVTPAYAEFFPDIIVTRAYETLNDAISAVGANERTIKIVSPQTVTALTIPSNVTLAFERDGAIVNSGQLTINTRNIRAPDRQIFTGAGDVDFADGSVIRSAWFPSLYKAINLTNDDSVTLLVTSQAHITTTCALGNDVTLKWDSPNNIIQVDSEVVFSNIKNIEAGNYQIFAGLGDYDFLDGTILKIDWFNSLRSVVAQVENEEVTLEVSDENVISYDNTIPSNLSLKIFNGGVLSIDAGRTLTLNSQLIAGDNQIISSDGSITFASGTKVKSAWFSTFEIAVTKIGAANVELEVSTASTIVDDCTINANTTLLIPSKGRILTVANTKTLTINGPFSAGLYQVFSGDGSVAFGESACSGVKPEWWGATGDGVTDDYNAIYKALATEKPVYFGLKTYIVNTAISSTNQYISGNKSLSIIKAGNSFPVGEYLLDWGGSAVDNCAQNTYLGGIFFDNNNRAGGIRIKNAYLSLVEDVRSNNAYTNCYGITFYGELAANRYYNLYSQSNSYGFLLQGVSPGIIYDNSFVGLRSQSEKGGIYLYQRNSRNVFMSGMIDCYSVDAATYGVKVASEEGNNYNNFIGIVAENTSANGTGYDDAGTTRDVFLSCMASSGFTTSYNINGYNWHLIPGDKFSGAEFASNNRVITLHGRFNGESPNGTMTWPAGDVRSSGVAGDGVYDVWDFEIPVRNEAIINIITIFVNTDDEATTTLVQLYKQQYNGTVTQIGIDQTFTGSGVFTTSDYAYELENGYMIYVRVSVKRSAGTYLYMYPVYVEGSW